MQHTTIEWVKNPDGSQGYSWNPIKGICPVGCWYCYARRMYQRFGWNPEILWNGKASLLSNKKPSRIFVCSTIEIFHPQISKEWRDRIFNVIEQDFNKKHTFQVLTKFPQNIDRKMPDNVWLGVTIDRKEYLADRYYYLRKVRARVKFISFEPLLTPMIYYLPPSLIKWVIVGKLTGHGKKYNPRKEWIEEIVKEAKNKNIPIFLKDNLKEIWGEPLIREFPE